MGWARVSLSHIFLLWCSSLPWAPPLTRPPPSDAETGSCTAACHLRMQKRAPLSVPVLLPQVAGC